MAALTDYLAFLSVIIFGVFILTKDHRLLLYYLVGGSIPAILHMFYHWYNFASPFVFATTFTNPAWRDENLLLGLLNLPSPLHLIEMLFLPRRGLFFHMPILIACVVGFGTWWKRSGRDSLFWLCITHIVILLLVNSSFNGWDGGYSVSLRYQITVLPFWILALKESRHIVFVSIAVIGSVASAVNMLAIAAVGPFVPSNILNPLYGFIYRIFLSGDFVSSEIVSIKKTLAPALEPFYITKPINAGQLLGLEGLASLLPLLILFIVAIYIALKCLTLTAKTQ